MKGKHVKDTQVAHLAGVFDAVGTISLQVVKSSDYRIGYTIQPILKLYRSNEEDPLLGKLLAYCDENGIKYNVGEQSHGKDVGTSVAITINDADSVERFLEPMMDYFVTNYIRADLMISEALPALRDEMHRNKEGFYELVGLSEQLREGRTKTGNVKYTQEYFAEEWSLPE
jgi:hypothetical protein